MIGNIIVSLGQYATQETLFKDFNKVVCLVNELGLFESETVLGKKLCLNATVSAKMFCRVCLRMAARCSCSMDLQTH